MNTPWPIVLCCFSGLLLSLETQAQPDRVADSLQHIIDTAPHDTIRINTLVQQAQYYRRTQSDRAVLILDTAMSIARKGNYPKYLRKVLSSAGITRGMRGDYTHALEHFNEALAIDRSRGDSSLVAGDYSNLGIVYKSLGDYGRSLELYLRALQLHNAQGNISGIASTYENMGVLHDLLHEPDRALECYLKSADGCRQQGVDPGRLYNNIGLAMAAKGQYDDALNYMNQFLEYSRQQGRKMDEADVLQNIGHVYWKKKDYTRAIDFNQKALQAFRSLGRKNGEHGALWSLGQVYLEQQNLREALLLADELEKLTRSLPSPVYQSQTSRLLARIYAAAGMYRRAFEEQEKYSVLHDSIFNTDKAQAYQQWQARLELAEKNHKIEQGTLQLQLLEARAETERRMRWLLVACLSLLAMMVLFLWYRYRLRSRTSIELEKRNRLIEAQKAEIEAINQELEKRMLRAQINPHFLFNALSSIQHFITINDRVSSLRYLSRFTNLLRQTLEQSTGVQVILAEEIKLLNNYLELEALRFNEGFEWVVEADDTVDVHNTEVPILLVQPYVENAVLHGLVPKKGQGRLSVLFSDDGHFTKCTIRDNGIGREASQALKQNSEHLQRPSRGMSITERRLALLAPANPVDNLVEWRDLYDDTGRAAGTEVVVRIPKTLK